MTGGDVKRIRNRADLTKSQLGRIIGRGYRTVHRWETETPGIPLPCSHGDIIVLEMIEKGELPDRYMEAKNK